MPFHDNTAFMYDNKPTYKGSTAGALLVEHGKLPAFQLTLDTYSEQRPTMLHIDDDNGSMGYDLYLKDYEGEICDVPAGETPLWHGGVLHLCYISKTTHAGNYIAIDVYENRPNGVYGACTSLTAKLTKYYNYSPYDVDGTPYDIRRVDATNNYLTPSQFYEHLTECELYDTDTFTVVTDLSRSTVEYDIELSLVECNTGVEYNLTTLTTLNMDILNIPNSNPVMCQNIVMPEITLPTALMSVLTDKAFHLKLTSTNVWTVRELSLPPRLKSHTTLDAVTEPFEFVTLGDKYTKVRYYRSKPVVTAENYIPFQYSGGKLFMTAILPMPLMMPPFKFDSEVEDIDGQMFVRKQVSYKSLQCEFPCSSYFADALRLIWHSNARKVYFDGREYIIDFMDVPEVNWESDNHYCIAKLTMRADTIIQTNAEILDKAEVDSLFDVVTPVLTTGAFDEGYSEGFD